MKGGQTQGQKNCRRFFEVMSLTLAYPHCFSHWSGCNKADNSCSSCCRLECKMKTTTTSYDASKYRQALNQWKMLSQSKIVTLIKFVSSQKQQIFFPLSYKRVCVIHLHTQSGVLKFQRSVLTHSSNFSLSLSWMMFPWMICFQR